MKQYLDKKEFYKYLSMVGKWESFFFTIRLNVENQRFELHYDWSSKTASGKFNPIMTAQLIDTKKNGFRKYVTPDLHWDCIKEKTTTQFTVWKKLNAWVEKALANYDLTLND